MEGRRCEKWKRVINRDGGEESSIAFSVLDSGRPLKAERVSLLSCGEGALTMKMKVAVELRLSFRVTQVWYWVRPCTDRKLPSTMYEKPGRSFCGRGRGSNCPLSEELESRDLVARPVSWWLTYWPGFNGKQCTNRRMRISWWIASLGKMKKGRKNSFLRSSKLERKKQLTWQGMFDIRWSKVTLIGYIFWFD